MSAFDSPFIVPLGAFAVAIVAIGGGIVSQIHGRKMIADQRMTMLARGIPLAEVEAVLAKVKEEEKDPPSDPMRRMGNARRAATALISSGLGIVAFFVLLWLILQERDVLSGAAVGAIPIAIGLGFWFDYNLQQREMSRFGLEAGE